MNISREYLALPISRLKLNTKAQNVLRENNVNIIYDLIVLSEMDLLNFYGFGKKSLDKVKEEFSKRGACLSLSKDFIESVLERKERT